MYGIKLFSILHMQTAEDQAYVVGMYNKKWISLGGKHLYMYGF